MIIEVIAFENRTTKMRLHRGGRRFGDGSTTQGFEMGFVQILERGVVLDLPPQSCSRGHRVEVELAVLAGPVKSFKAGGEVTGVETAQGERDTVTLKFLSFDQAGWKGIHETYSGRQSNLMRLLAEMKGDA